MCDFRDFSKMKGPDERVRRELDLQSVGSDLYAASAQRMPPGAYYLLADVARTDHVVRNHVVARLLELINRAEADGDHRMANALKVLINELTT